MYIRFAYCHAISSSIKFTTEIHRRWLTPEPPPCVRLYASTWGHNSLMGVDGDCSSWKLDFMPSSTRLTSNEVLRWAARINHKQAKILVSCSIWALHLRLITIAIFFLSTTAQRETEREEQWRQTLVVKERWRQHLPEEWWLCPAPKAVETGDRMTSLQRDERYWDSRRLVRALKTHELYPSFNKNPPHHPIC